MTEIGVTDEFLERVSAQESEQRCRPEHQGVGLVALADVSRNGNYMRRAPDSLRHGNHLEATSAGVHWGRDSRRCLWRTPRRRCVGPPFHPVPSHEMMNVWDASTAVRSPDPFFLK